ncbi:MAG: hypothetical protein ACRC6A_02120 [Fusobacteriaceae bacterium]
MGIRRTRSALIVCISLISSLLYGMDIYVQSKDSSFIEKIIDGFLAAGPTLLLAFFSICFQRKKDELNEEKKKKQAQENLEKEWYNQIVLIKLLDPLSEYFDYLEDNMGTTDIESLKSIKKKRMNCLRKLSILKIFDEDLHRNCLDKLMLSTDNERSCITNMSKRIINRRLKSELYQNMYQYIKR